jgi:hypothetical protein
LSICEDSSCGRQFEVDQEVIDFARELWKSLARSFTLQVRRVKKIVAVMPDVAMSRGTSPIRVASFELTGQRGSAQLERTAVVAARILQLRSFRS